MRKNQRPFFYSILTVGLLLGGAALTLWLAQPKEHDRVQASLAAPKQQAQPPAIGLVDPQLTLAPGATVVPVPTAFPAAAWGSPPQCANNPLAVSAAAQSVAAPSQGGTANSDLRRAMLVAPGLAALPADEVQGLAAAQPAAEGRQALLGLAVNVGTGRLNRATQVSFDGVPEVKTVGDVLDQLEDALQGQPPSPALIQAAKDLQDGKGISTPVCAHLLMTQSQNHPDELLWSASAVSAQTVPVDGLGKLRVAMDTVVTAPDGRMAAYTSVGNDSGGPIFVLDLQSRKWNNLIDLANKNLKKDQPPLPTDGWWDVIGWMPDSQRLMIGSADASAVYIINAVNGKFSVIPFNGGGKGGGMFVGLAPDGSQFVFAGEADQGTSQTLSAVDLKTKQARVLFTLPYAAGVLYYPRFSPDGTAISYILQKGEPQSGLSYAIKQYLQESNTERTLVEGNLGLSVPTWSPDGKYLAFTKKDADQPDLLNPAQPLDQPRSNVWVIDVGAGQMQQVTFVSGQAGRPHWAADARTLSFITHDGQVGLVSLDQPGQVWRAAAGSPEFPEFSSAAFLP